MSWYSLLLRCDYQLLMFLPFSSEFSGALLDRHFPQKKMSAALASTKTAKQPSRSSSLPSTTKTPPALIGKNATMPSDCAPASATRTTTAAAAPAAAAVMERPERSVPKDAAEAALWHGYGFAGAFDVSDLPSLPMCIARSDDLARPQYTNIKSAEYCDHPDVLEAKADFLIEMIKKSKQMMVYAGAGISTSAGCSDYASNASSSTVQAKKQRLTAAFIMGMKPTVGHRVITALEKRGHVQHWLQQNHDGLAQRAGFPPEKVNEVHGSWHDASNPVVKMSGNLRDDLFAQMLEWEKKADFVFAVGTSFSGMNADRCAEACAQRHMKKGEGCGLALVTIQQTPMDVKCCLRVFSKIDDFMTLVAKKMNLKIDTKTYAYPGSKLKA